MDSLRRASGFLFYVLGTLMIIGVVLLRRGIFADTLNRVFSLIDLPLLFIAMLYGGSSFYCSIARGKRMPGLAAGIFILLLVLFGVFCWLNFAYPIAEV